MSSHENQYDRSIMDLDEIEYYIRRGHRLRNDYIVEKSKHIYERLATAFNEALRGDSYPHDAARAR